MTTDFEYDVFFSHSSVDKPHVRDLAQRLKGDSLRIWLDEWIIQPGDSIPLAIGRGLESSRVLVLVMSKNAFASDWVDLEHHTAIFRDPANRTRRFVPLRLDDAAIKDGLRHFAYVDWRNKDEAEYQKLLRVCRGPVGVSDEMGDQHDTPNIAVAIELDRPFSSFDQQSQDELLSEISRLLQIARKVVVLYTRPGSVVVTIELTKREAHELIGAVYNQQLSQFRVTRAQIISASESVTSFDAGSASEKHERPRPEFTRPRHRSASVQASPLDALSNAERGHQPAHVSHTTHVGGPTSHGVPMKSASISSQEWQDVSEQLLEEMAPGVIAEIGRLSGFRHSDNRANLATGVKAALNGLNLEDAEKLRNRLNLERFIVLQGDFKGTCLECLPPQPKPFDVELGVQLVRHGFSGADAKALHDPRGREEFVKFMEEFKKEFIEVLKGHQPPEDVKKAFTKTIEKYWDKRHAYWAILFWMATAAGFWIASLVTWFMQGVDKTHDSVVLKVPGLVSIFIALFLVGKGRV